MRCGSIYAPRVAQCLSIILLLRLARLPPPIDSDLFQKLWQLPPLILDHYHEVVSEFSSSDADIPFTINFVLSDNSEVNWEHLSDSWFPLYRRWLLFTHSPGFPISLWPCAVLLFGRILRAQCKPVESFSFFQAMNRETMDTVSSSTQCMQLKERTSIADVIHSIDLIPSLLIILPAAILQSQPVKATNLGVASSISFSSINGMFINSFLFHPTCCYITSQRLNKSHNPKYWSCLRRTFPWKDDVLLRLRSENGWQYQEEQSPAPNHILQPRYSHSVVLFLLAYSSENIRYIMIIKWTIFIEDAFFFFKLLRSESPFPQKEQSLASDDSCFLNLKKYEVYPKITFYIYTLSHLLSKVLTVRWLSFYSCSIFSMLLLDFRLAKMEIQDEQCLSRNNRRDCEYAIHEERRTRSSTCFLFLNWNKEGSDERRDSG